MIITSLKIKLLYIYIYIYSLNISELALNNNSGFCKLFWHCGSILIRKCHMPSCYVLNCTYVMYVLVIHRNARLVFFMHSPNLYQRQVPFITNLYQRQVPRYHQSLPETSARYHFFKRQEVVAS